MIQTIKPDSKIYIGIRNKKVICIDWKEIMDEKLYTTNTKMQKGVIQYLKDAIKMLEKDL